MAKGYTFRIQDRLRPGIYNKAVGLNTWTFYVYASPDKWN